MKKSDITYIVGAAFAAAVSFFYCCTRWFAIKLPRYYPALHEWKWGKVKGEISQGWYGMQGFAYLMGGIVALIVYILCKRAGSKDGYLKPGAIKAVGLTCSAVIVACMGYMLYHEFHKWHIF